MVSKILFVTLSNIGDVILTLPVLDRIRRDYPQAKISVLVGPRPKEIFEGNPCISEVIIYDKQISLKRKIGLFRRLNAENFDLVVDLRNSCFGAFLKARYRTSPFLSIPKKIRHMKERHFYKIKKLPAIKSGEPAQKKSLCILPQDQKYVNDLLIESGIRQEDRIIVVAPGARSHIKRWQKEKFTQLISSLKKEFKVQVVLIGDKEDSLIAEFISDKLKGMTVNLCSRMHIRQLAALIAKAELVITNDSAIGHLASYLDTAVLTIFGPTDEKKYGPWSKGSALVKKDIFCRPCEKAQCQFGNLKCMQLIKTEDVLREVKDILIGDEKSKTKSRRADYKRILIMRTDRIGDVLLSTPAIKAIRENYPCAYIAMVVRPYAYEIIKDNPFLDEVIVYDKYGKDRDVFSSLKFAHRLKKMRLDLILVLHPTNRANLIAFLAGARRRIGFDRKLGFLLTDRIKHLKEKGEKHEIEYSLDLVRHLGIEPEEKTLFISISQDASEWLDQRLKSLKINDNDKLLAVHPGASCPSKIWPVEECAKACDGLIEKYNFKVLLIGARENKKISEELAQKMRHSVNNLTGETSISQLASLLKRCELFISNDSGPVHIASAVGTPVVSIFGRSQKGLSPQRWGPVGNKDKFLHKPVGCIECLAHNCVKEFACLKAITAEDVLRAADEILK